MQWNWPAPKFSDRPIHEHLKMREETWVDVPSTKTGRHRAAVQGSLSY